MRYLTVWIALAIMLIAIVQPAMGAIVNSIPFITSDSFIFAEPLSSTGLTIEQFNSSSLFASHASDLSITFPLSSGRTTAGPATGSLSVDGVAGGIRSSNALSLGPMNIALPRISQDVDDRLAYERSYFFTDTF